jgi:pimeloyl-ACP methyl ester carboxylesterase
VKIKSVSKFKDKAAAAYFFEKWVSRVSELSGTNYERINIETSLGNTVIWGINTEKKESKPIVIFPGFRTSSLFWDMDNALAPLKNDYRIYLVETNGQPNLSDGNTPDIKGNGYGIWANEVLEKLSLEKAIIAGASFGGLVCLKLCIINPGRVEKAILLNPGCLQPFSLSWKNLYYNLLPLLLPNQKNVERFLDKAVFYKDKHIVSPAAKKLIMDYELFAIRNYRDRTQKPYAMSKQELEKTETTVYLILGEKDILFPCENSLSAARKHIRKLRGVHIIPGNGHGIETSKIAMEVLSLIAETTENPLKQVKERFVNTGL